MAKTMRQGMIPGMEGERMPDETALATAVQNDADPRTAPARDEIELIGDLETIRADAPQTLRGETVWVVDANSLIFQVFHALPEMTSPRGEPVSAVFGLSRDMLYLLEEKKPTYLLVAFDGPERTFRHEMYNDYKHIGPRCPSTWFRNSNRSAGC